MHKLIFGKMNIYAKTKKSPEYSHNIPGVPYQMNGISLYFTFFR